MGQVLRALLLLPLVGVLLVSSAGAQSWVGEAEVRGVVTDIDEQPIVGALVTLSPVDQPELWSSSVETDTRGRWRIGGIPSTRWRVTIKAKDFVTVEGWVESADGPTAAVEVWMRPLAEVTAAFAESSSSVVRWLEKANTLLEQGQYEAAREEYEKALGALPRMSWPQVLQSMARTHYLQGESAKALTTLEWALAIDPRDQTSAQLYSVLLEQLGRSTEATEFLEEIQTMTPAELEALADRSSEVSPAVVARSLSPARQLEPPIEEARAGRTGSYRVRFVDESPHASLEILLERLDLDRAEVERLDPAGGRYDLQDESFTVFVPPSYSPDAEYGLFVWISPTPFGGFASLEMQEALEAANLIWVGADDAGNGRALWYRYLLALEAVHNMRQLYRIDEASVFVGGYSGGGRVTSGLAMLFPEVFRGGYSMSGCDYPERLAVPDKPGAHWPPGFPAPAKPVFREVKAKSRFVLLAGELDFNRAQTRKTYLRMLDDGFENVLYLQVAGASHYDHPDEETLTRGFRFLTSASEQ